MSLHPFRRAHRDDTVTFPQLDDPIEIFLLGELFPPQPVAEATQLVAIEIADEFVDQLRPRARCWTHAVSSQLGEDVGTIARAPRHPPPATSVSRSASSVAGMRTI